MDKDLEFKADILFIAMDYIRTCVNNGATGEQAVLEAQSERGQQEIAKRYKAIKGLS